MLFGLLSKKCGQTKEPFNASEGMGYRWGCISVDRPTRFVVAFAFAASEDKAASLVVAETRQRTSYHRGVSWVSDGRKVYRREIKRVYREPKRLGKGRRPSLVFTTGTGLTEVVKHRCGGKVVSIKVSQVLGQPIECPYTVHVEHLNGVLRDRLKCLTRCCVEQLVSKRLQWQWRDR